jgi:hypothetical protein
MFPPTFLPAFLHTLFRASLVRASSHPESVRERLATPCRRFFGVVALFICGCGGITDGGPVGTGIAAYVGGNIVSVEEPGLLAEEETAETTSTMAADRTGGIASVAGVEVSLAEVPDVRSTTDEKGNFQLRGEFAGSVTLQFDSGGITAEQRLEVPEGGTIILSDIALDGSSVTAEARRQTALRGEILRLDCERGELQVRNARKTTFAVDLVSTTEFFRGEIQSTCEDITVGDEVSVDGVFVDEEGLVLRALLVDAEPDAAPPEEVRVVAFIGELVAVNCSRNFLRLHDGVHGLRVGIDDDTPIRESGSTRSCDELELGDLLTAVGVVDLEDPGPMLALRLFLDGRGGTGKPLPIRGFVERRNCSRDRLHISLEGMTAVVQLLPDTEITPQGLTCNRIPLGSSVRGKGTVSEEVRDGIDALELTFKSVRP